MLEDVSEGEDSPRFALAPSAPKLVSPSLTGAGEGPLAYEMKFLVSAAQAERIQHWAKQQLGVDPYANAARNDSYETTTLYLDTPQFSVYHRTPGFRRRKYRVRRYNTANTIFMECKIRRGDEVSKHRCSLPLEEVARFDQPAVAVSWLGAEYHQALLERALRPACLMTYERSAYLSSERAGPLRLTLDRQIRGVPCDAWNATPLANGTPILCDEVICELKFRDTMPLLFKQLVAEFHLEPAAVSKYRRMMAALGCLPPEGCLPEDPHHV